MNIILHSDDINLTTHWQKALNDSAMIVDDVSELFKVESSLIIINFTACIPDISTVLNKLNANENRVLILHRVPEFSTAKKLISLGALGYGNALMREHFIVSAVNTIEENMVWLYPEYTSQLIGALPDENSSNNDELLESLTSREKEVALLLKDSFTYKDIAQKLDITPRTVKAHAQHTYKKLSVKDRLGLALLLK